jgi:type IV pilus assembly protein PilA
MLETLRRKRDNDEGFTLIELMVVVLIIAILLAIAIPTFLGAQNRAKDRGAQSNLRNSLTAAKTIATDNEGVFTTVSSTTLNTAEPSLTHIATGLTGTSTSKEIHVAVSNGILGNASEGTGSGVLLLTVRSASGSYFGICADYKGTVKYAQAASAEAAIGDCTADKFS